MSPLFYEDSLGARLAEKMLVATGRAHEAEDSYIDDPEELERAERAVHDLDTTPDYDVVGDDWVVVFGPSKVSGFLDVAGVSAMMITMPLDAEDIAYCWDPYPPEDMPGAATPAEHAIDQPFTLRVAPTDASRARELLATTHAGSRFTAGLPAGHDPTPGARANRSVLAATALFILWGVSAAGMIIAALYWLMDTVRHNF